MPSSELTVKDRKAATELAALFFDHLDTTTFLASALKAMGKSMEALLTAYICYDQQGSRICHEVVSSTRSLPEIENLFPPDDGFAETASEAEEGHRINLPELLPTQRSHETRCLSSSLSKQGDDHWLQSSLEDNNQFVHVLIIGRSTGAFQDAECRLVHHVFPRFLRANKYNTLILERRLQIETGLPLSKREKEIAALLAEGKTNPQIGETLHISGRTVEKHCSNIFKKMGFENRNVAVRYFLDFNPTFSQPSA